jgi:transcriptional regulator with XRE-family HTH domain
MASMEKSIHTTVHKKLQRLLKQVRLGAGLRQEDLAVLLGKPQSFVSKYEKGNRRLDLIELRQICEAVGISLTDFVKRFEEFVPK